MLSRFVVRPWMKRGVRILLILLVLISMAGVTFVEIRRHQSLILPAPTGPYAVGRREYDWTDQSRDDPLAPHSGLKRELVVWAWYPALREPGAEIASYLPSKWAQLSDEQHGFIGQQLLQSNDSIQTHSLDRAPLSSAAARYPVLIFEPGLGTIPTQYTTLLEDLASHGYIIFAITPTYSSDVVVFPDGRVASATPAGSLDNMANLQEEGNRLVTVWAQDVIFVMNRLDQLDATPGNMWSQRLDLARLGVFGHSFGGATAAQVCQMGAHKAGIDIDGDLFGSVVQTGLEKPFLVIQHDMRSCSDAACRLPLVPARDWSHLAHGATGRALFHQHHRHEALQLHRLRRYVLAPTRLRAAGFHRRSTRTRDHSCVCSRLLRYLSQQDAFSLASR